MTIHQFYENLHILEKIHHTVTEALSKGFLVKSGMQQSVMSGLASRKSQLIYRRQYGTVARAWNSRRKECAADVRLHLHCQGL